MPQVLCPVLIGRSDDLGKLEEAISEARAGSGGVVFVVGEAGIGKSRLLRETANRALDLGMTVLSGRAVLGGARTPFRPIIEGVQSWTRTHGVPDDPTLTPYRSALGWLIPEWIPRGSRPVSPVMIIEAVVRLLRAIAGRNGLVLSLDDLHWADADTLAIVEYLADNLGSESVLCLCALRSDEESPASRLADGLVARRAASRLALRRLRDREVDEMIRAALPTIGEPIDLEAIRARAEGVPFLVEEMLSAYLDSGRPSLPASFHKLVRDRMARVPAEAREVIQTAAAVGRDFDWTVISPITGLDREAVLAALRAAIGVRLIQSDDGSDEARFRFRHALIQEAILDDLLPPERAELYRRAASALEEAYPGLPGELCEVAAEIHERAGDRTNASRLLLEIARRALGTTALGTAESALRRALELADGDRWRRMGVHRLLVRVLSLSGKTTGLNEIGDDALAFFHERSFVGGPLQFSDLHFQIARGLAATADRAAVDRHLDRARRWAERGEHQHQLARIDAFRAHVLLGRGGFEDAAELAARAGEVGLELGLDDVVCEALRAESELAFLRGDPGLAVRTLQRAKTVADRADLTLDRAKVHLALARIDSSTTLGGGDIAKARELSQRIGAVAIGAEVDLEVAGFRLERFELAAAADAADHAASVCRRYGLGLLPWALVTQARILAVSGDKQSVERLVAEASGTGPEVAAVAAGEARAMAHLLREERAQAVAALDAAIESAKGGPAALVWPFHGMRMLLDVLGGATFADATRSMPSPGVLSHVANRGLLASAEAVHLARHGASGRALQLVAEAEELLGPFVWRRSLALRLLAEAALADGWGEPARWGEESLRFFESAGRERVAAACRGLLRRAGVRVSRRGRGDSTVPRSLATLGITSRELDVLSLIGDGLSNAEIAERLFVSVRTVESHASRLLRKAGLESRSQLVAFVTRMEGHVEGSTRTSGRRR